MEILLNLSNISKFDMIFLFKNFHFKKFEPFCVWLVFVLKSILYWGSAHVVKHDPNNYPSNATSSGNPVFNFKILESFVLYVVSFADCSDYWLFWVGHVVYAYDLTAALKLLTVQVQCHKKTSANFLVNHLHLSRQEKMCQQMIQRK